MLERAKLLASPFGAKARARAIALVANASSVNEPQRAAAPERDTSATSTTRAGTRNCAAMALKRAASPNSAMGTLSTSCPPARSATIGPTPAGSPTGMASGSACVHGAFIL